MKTPREVLFKRHESAPAKLEQVRTRAMAEISPAISQKQSDDVQASSWLQNLVRSFRPHFAALAAVWLVILGFHLAARENSNDKAVVTVAPSPEIFATLREQKRLYSQLLGSSEVIRPAEPALPDRRPRSEEKQLVRIV